MKTTTLACGALLLALSAMPASAPAQTVTDDVQCLVVSALFAKNASQDAAKQIATRAMAFYVGRLDARANPQAVKSQIQALKIDPKTAPARMQACATRVNQVALAMLPGSATEQRRR